MIIKTLKIIGCVLLFVLLSSCKQEMEPYDVIVLGEGTGAVAAAIQSARSGAKTLYVNPLPWHGGMLTAAGVSATDGNHQLPSGLWGEWRQLIWDHYGGPDSVFTGWVSNTQFEPHVGAKKWEQLVIQESRLTVRLNSEWKQVIWSGGSWEVTLENDHIIRGDIIIDGTDLGDIIAEVDIPFDIGMDASSQTGEAIAPQTKNDIIQDLTYVAILKDYGTQGDHLIQKPVNYDPAEFHCCCQYNCNEPNVHPCETMLSYARLPNNKYLINWPIKGNDVYLNPINASDEERTNMYEIAKAKTMRFIYFIQNELGYQNLGLADDEFDTPDLLPYIPYHREARRMKGKVQLNVNHLLKPFDFSLYRTGIAVGDYPIDHHHDENESAPAMDFPKIPSFSIPIGSLIPHKNLPLLAADKSISVTNIVNGSSRLQPVIVQVGQAAGVIAAIMHDKGQSFDQLSIREIQDSLLSQNGFLQPYIDIDPSDPDFGAIQRIGSTGILRGEGRPFQWANQTWFYPDSLVSSKELYAGLIAFDRSLESLTLPGKDVLHPQDMAAVFDEIEAIMPVIQKFSLSMDDRNSTRPITRREVAKWLDVHLDPFHRKDVNFAGEFMK